MATIYGKDAEVLLGEQKTQAIADIKAERVSEVQKAWLIDFYQITEDELL